MRVYYGLGRLLSKLSKAQSSGKFREQHNNQREDVRTAAIGALSYNKNRWLTLDRTTTDMIRELNGLSVT